MPKIVFVFYLFLCSSLLLGQRDSSLVEIEYELERKIREFCQLEYNEFITFRKHQLMHLDSLFELEDLNKIERLRKGYFKKLDEVYGHQIIGIEGLKGKFTEIDDEEIALSKFKAKIIYEEALSHFYNDFRLHYNLGKLIARDLKYKIYVRYLYEKYEHIIVEIDRKIFDKKKYYLECYKINKLELEGKPIEETYSLFHPKLKGVYPKFNPERMVALLSITLE